MLPYWHSFYHAFIRFVHLLVVDGFTTKQLIFRWTGEIDPIQFNENFAMPEFILNGYSTGDCKAQYVTGERATILCVPRMLHKTFKSPRYS